MELSREHIIYNLGIPVPLNESIHFSRPMELRILHEQMLYETFLDSIKNYASEKFNQVVTTIKDWKDAAVVIGKVLSNGDLLNDFLKPLERRVVNLIQPLTDFLKKIKLDSFIEKIKQFIEKIKSLQGWKKFMALVTAGSIITFIIEKLKSLAPNAVKDFLTKYFSPTFVKDVLGKLTDFQSYLGFLQPIVKGAEIIFNFLKPLIEAFAVAFKSGSKLATKLIKENKMRKSELKNLIRERILKEAEETALPNLDGIKTSDAKQAANFIRNNKQIQKLIGNINNPNEVNEFFSVLLGYMQDIKGVNKQNLKGLIDTKFK
jgi:nitrogen regulatory protein PII-like uncharacterized protein